jgi:membrane-associated protease RseP (regulator of RpoE activity)
VSAAPGTESPIAATGAPRPRSIRTNLVFFALSVVSTFYVGAEYWVGHPVHGLGDLVAGWVFAVPLLFILLCHEFGHYLMARRHQVDASLPYFIPFPFFFGTFGAIIRMRSPISTRKALLDIGATGPLAGMVAAVPILILGLTWSTIGPVEPGVGLQEGQSILYVLVKRVAVGPIPEGHDVWLHPVAMAGWIGFLITMFNLLPVGQLDGGHIAYALFGKWQDRLSRLVQLALVPLGLGLCLYHGLTALSAGETGDRLMSSFMMGGNWLVWAVALQVLRMLTGPQHPPTDEVPLSLGRRAVAIGCLILFVVLFMPVPMHAN